MPGFDGPRCGRPSPVQIRGPSQVAKPTGGYPGGMSLPGPVDQSARPRARQA